MTDTTVKARMTIAERLRVTLEMIKIEHTLFALPFAFLGATLAAREIRAQPVSFWVSKLIWITVAMVGARSAAMTFNRIADRKIDARNPRTATRALASGLLDLRFAWIFTVAASLLFVLASWQLNRLTLILSPVALGSVFLYSYTKRFTALSHLVLGWCLSIAPSGAWIAIKGELNLLPVLLSLAVMLWTAGFDILYACQDLEFDRRHGLLSIPTRFGVRRSILLSRLMHVATIGAMAALWRAADLPPLYLVGVFIVAVLLTYEQSLVSDDDLSQVKRAFDLNGYVGIVYFVVTAVSLYLR